MGRLAGIVVALVLVTGACGSGEPGADLAEPGSRPTSTTGAPVTVGDQGGGPSPAPGFDFTASLVGGGSFDGAAVAGTDLAVWFWSPW